MSAKQCQKILLGTAALATQIVVSTSFAQRPIAPPVVHKERFTLTASEFQRLSPERKKEWLEALQEFVISVEKIESRSSMLYTLQETTPIGVFSWLRVKTYLPKICSVAQVFFRTEVSEAQARALPSEEEPPEVDIDKLKSDLVREKAHLEKLMKIPKSSLRNGTTPAALQTLISKQSERVRTLNEQIDTAYATPRYTVPNSLSDAPSPSAKPFPWAEDVLKQAREGRKPETLPLQELDLPPVSTDAAKPMKEAPFLPLRTTGDEKTFKIEGKPADRGTYVNPDYKEGARLHSEVLAADEEVQKLTKSSTSTTDDIKAATDRAAAAREKLRKFDEKAEVEKVAAAKPDMTDVSCIYAGSIQTRLSPTATSRRARCPQPNEVTLTNKKNIATTFSCKSPAKAASPAGKTSATTAPVAGASTPTGETQVVYGDNGGGKNTVICNPLVFSFEKSVYRKPICVSPSATATADCAAKALALAKSVSGKQLVDPSVVTEVYGADFNKFTAKVDALCAKNQDKSEYYKNNLNMKNAKEIATSVADLTATCEVLQAKLAAMESHSSASPSGGSAGGQ